MPWLIKPRRLCHTGALRSLTIHQLTTSIGQPPHLKLLAGHRRLTRSLSIFVLGRLLLSEEEVLAALGPNLQVQHVAQVLEVFHSVHLLVNILVLLLLILLLKLLVLLLLGLDIFQALFMHHL